MAFLIPVLAIMISYRNLLELQEKEKEQGIRELCHPGAFSQTFLDVAIP